MRSMSAQDGAKPIVIVGGGLAGGTPRRLFGMRDFAAESCSSATNRGPIRSSPLSKTYLRSEEDLDGWYVRPAPWYEEHDVERLESTVAQVDPAEHKVVLESGEEIEYGRS
jgi:3-phenylpropionate/trans-cinnamate dioxygenase ferredoxin reductase subunit